MKQLAQQLDSISATYKCLKGKSKYGDLSDLGYSTAHNLITRSRAAIERASGKDSAYNRQVQDILSQQKFHDFQRLTMVVGVVEALSTDIQAGYLSSVSELIRGEIFGDFLEMADHLLAEGYKDATAVIVGGTLETHLRQLCVRHGILTETNTSGRIRPKKADLMNTDLANIGVVSKLDQKNVTAWLDLRNKAAHGRYTDYTQEQITLLLAGVRDFITRNPA